MSAFAGPVAAAGPPNTGSTGADLAVAISDQPDPVQVGEVLTYTISVNNVGRRTATSTTVSDSLPSSVTYKSASASQGSCTGTTTVSCNVGDVAKSGTVTVAIDVTPNSSGTISDTASASSAADGSTGNNTATAQTTVESPPAPTPTPAPSVAPDTSPWWLQRCPTPCLHPSARAEAPMAYDPTTGQTVLGGGRTQSGLVDDTWTWDGTVWTQHPNLVPRPPYSGWSGSMAFDPATHHVLLFDAWAGTWLWDGANAKWLQVSPVTNPGRREYAAMAYDPASRRLVLFGGMDPYTGDLFGDTWTWDGTNWTRETAASPSPRVGAGMATDPASGGVVLFGGCGGSTNSSTCTPLGDTWTWNGTTRTWLKRAPLDSPQPRYGVAIAGDDARQETLLLGGMSDAGIWRDVWLWDGSDWNAIGASRLGPDYRGFASEAYDSNHRQVVLFGGVGVQGVLDDTWTYGSAL